MLPFQEAGIGPPLRLAHLSDLHIGRSVETDRRAVALCRSLLASDVDHFVVTGDVTHRGRKDELARFQEIFRPLLEGGRLTVVPGNHDRLGDDIGAALLGDDATRVSVVRTRGLHLVRVDSTGPHNRALLESHGLLTDDDIHAITEAIEGARPGALCVLLLHHHLLPFPHDSAAEWLSAVLGWSWASELPTGRRLLERLRGRCDLVMHGHRHRPGITSLFQEDARPLSVCNAGASADLGRVRVFGHAGGRLVDPPHWMAAGVRARARREHVGSLVALQ